MKNTAIENPDSPENGDNEANVEKSFYNCHTHIFNFEHVHNNFLKGMIPWWVGSILFVVGVLLLTGAILSHWIFFASLLIVFAALVLFVAVVIIFPLQIHKLLKGKKFKRIATFLKKAIPGDFDFLERYANFILHAYEINSNETKTKTQETVFNELQSYYPQDTKFIVLSMDMNYMVNCNERNEQTKFYEQLHDLRELKKSTVYQKVLFPFIHTDPRRLEIDKEYYSKLVEDIKSGVFNGIKIYPPLGYFPFDIRLKPVYDLALKYDLPITSHCSVGPVYYRGSLKTLKNDGYFDNGKFIHPFTGQNLEGKNTKTFSPHFTHPLNYYFLMNCPEKLYEYWKKCESEKRFNLSHLPMGNYTVDDLKKYRKLKICLGHFGGSEEWRRYLDNAWQPKERLELKKPESFKRMILEKNGMWKLLPEKKEKIRDIKALNWFTIISEMLKFKDENGADYFPNLYADISYNLSDQKMMPLLKVRLETDAQLRRKVLFGTDFYMVSMKITERRATINLRAFLGEDNFQQIAVENPKAFLRTEILPSLH